MSQALKAQTMKPLLLLFASALIAAPLAAQASGSLYDSNTAQAPGPDMSTVLGPKSSSIRYDSRMLRAAEIAQQRARAHSTSRCWHYVKDALVAAHVVSSRPETAYAKQAAAELTSKYGFKKLNIKNPLKAPVGAVLVYGGRDAGHVEIRTRTGFVSDFFSSKPYLRRPLIGIYVPSHTST